MDHGMECMQSRERGRQGESNKVANKSPRPKSSYVAGLDRRRRRAKCDGHKPEQASKQRDGCWRW